MMKIFVVDDEPGICKNIEQIFLNIGFSVVTTSDSGKALNLFKKEKPKIIFLDIKMPNKSGFELLKEFKQIDPSCVVFMVTAHDGDENKDMAVKLGASDFIKKPFSHNYLRDVVLGQIHSILDEGGHMQKPRILIVDDEEVTLKDVEKCINSAFEAEIELGVDGIQAIEKTESFKPDVILLDVTMPRMSGIDALPEIRKLAPEAVIIVLSAWNSMEVVSKATSFGIKDYLTKPFPPTALKEKMKETLISIGKLIVKK